MVDYPIIRFVSGPDSTTARLDLNDAAPFIVDHDGFSFGTPSYEAEPLSVGAVYSWRDVTIHARIDGDASVAAPAAAALSVELLRRTNWLMYQHDAASDPVWVRTFATQPPPLNFENVNLDESSSYAFEMTIKADPYLTLPEVTVAEQTISNAEGYAKAVVNRAEGDVKLPGSVAQ